MWPWISDSPTNTSNSRMRSTMTPARPLDGECPVDVDRMFDLSPRALARLGLDGRFTRVNASWTNVFGLCRNWLESGDLQQLEARLALPPNTLQCMVKDVLRDEKQFVAREISFKNPAGSMKAVRLEFQVARSHDGICRHLLLIANDITEIRTAQRELADERKRLQAATEALEQLSYYMTHELRPPLRSIQVACHDLVETTSEGPEVERVLQSTLLLGGLVDDLTALARLGRRNLKPELFDLGALAQNAFDSRPEKIGTLTVVGNPTAFADRGLMKKVLNELLSNACHAIQARPFPATIFEMTQGPEGPVYSVEDNGCGFNMEYHDRIFLPFERLQGPPSLSARGMGLARVRKIIELHGGRVWAESVPGNGSRFCFTLNAC